MSFLNYDSPFMADVRKITDFVLLGLLWMMASFPLFTFGAATTAMYFTAHNVIHLHGGGLWKTFWSSFRKEFKQGTQLWLIGLLVTVPLALNALLLWKVQLNDVVFALLLATVLLGIGWMQLWYGYLSKFEDKVGTVLINCFRIALVNLPKLLLMLIICAAAIAGAVLAFFYVFPVMALIPGIYAGFTGMVLRSIFKPYLSSEEQSSSQ